MFNPLTPADVVTAIGLVARGAARSDDSGGSFERDQLMSAYSATRHLAGELDAYPAELERFRADLSRTLAAAAQRGGSATARLAAAAEQVERTVDARPIGAILSDVLADLRQSGDPCDAEARAEVQALLRELADREVNVLAAALT